MSTDCTWSDKPLTQAVAVWKNDTPSPPRSTVRAEDPARVIRRLFKQELALARKKNVSLTLGILRKTSREHQKRERASELKQKRHAWALEQRRRERARDKS